MFLKILAFSMLLASANAVKEIVYTYEGYLSVGTIEPANYYSYTIIAADLIVLKQENNDYWMQLENVNYMAFSGSGLLNDEDNSTEWHLVPKESEAVDLPFIYHADKTKNGITTSKNDLPWSRNFKKAIGDLFVNDPKVFDSDIHSFKSEDGFDYHVLGTDKIIHVTKMMSGDMFKNYAQETNEDIKIEEHYPLPIFRKYRYEIFPKTKNFRKIDASSQVDYNPLNGMSEKFYMYVNQTLIYKKKRNSELAEMDLSSMEYYDVDFSMNAYFTEAGGLDLSKGRVEIDMDATVKDLKKDLQKFFDYLSQSHITLTKTFVNEEDHIDSVIRRLKYLDEKHLLNLYSSVVDNEDLSKLLVEIISLLGTPASCTFIVDMIKDNKLKGVEALDALGDLPMHAIVMPDELKTKLMKLALNGETEDIRYQAVLTLSNFVSKSVHKPGHENNDIIDSFIEKLKDSTEQKEQLLYVYALRNIKNARTNEELLKTAKGAKGYSNITTHARAESLYGLDRSQNSEDAMWLMFMNRNEKFEIRAAILNILVAFDRPSNIEKMFYMLYQENDDDELNHLFYKKLEMISETDLDQYDKSRTRAMELLPFFDKPVESLSKSSSYLLEIFDEGTGVGSAFELTYYGDISEHNFTMIRFKSTTKMSGPTSDVNEYYAYTDFDYSDIDFDNIFSKIMSMELSFVEVVNGRVLSVRTYDWSNMLSLLLTDEEEKSKSRKKMYMMDQQHRDEILIPTDMGIPVVFRNNAGYIFKLETQFEAETHSKAVFDMVYRSSEIYGFTSYNPISNTWIGIRRVKTIDMKLGFDIDYKVDFDNKLVKATLNKGKNPSGIQSFVYSHVFARDTVNGELVKKSCPKCELDNLITNGEDQLEGHVYLDYDNEDTGSHYKMAVYDCEQRVTASYLSMTDISDLWNKFMASPTPGMCGVGFMMENSEKYPAAHLTLQLSADDNEYPNSDTYDNFDAFKLTYNIKNDDKLVKSWDFRLINGRFNHTWYNAKVSATEIRSGVPVYRLCFDSVENWYRDHVTSHTTILAGNEFTDDKCPKTGSVVKLIGKGERSEEMEKLDDPEKIFSSCIEDHSNSFEDCLREVSSYRQYTYDITFDNLNENEIDFWMKVQDYLRLSYSDEFIRMRRNPKIAKNEMKMTINYPVYYKTVNVSLMSHLEAYRYDDVDVSDLYDLMYPAPYSTFTMSNDHFNDYCEVGAEYVTNEPGQEYRELNYVDNWATLSRLEKNNETVHLIKVQRDLDDANDLILHLQYYKDVVELSFTTDFKLKVNDEVVKMKPNVLMPINESFDVLMTHNNGENHRVFVNMVANSVTVEYTRDKVRMSLDADLDGECDD